MNDENPMIKRRVYDLPTELVERISAFQRERNLPSEVEAARRLLDMALKSRDTLESLIGRFLKVLESSPEPSDAAALVLVGHPLVKGVQFLEDSISFNFQKGTDDAIEVHAKNYNNISIGELEGYEMSFSPYYYEQNYDVGYRLLPKKKESTGNIDDEIPF